MTNSRIQETQLNWDADHLGQHQMVRLTQCASHRSCRPNQQVQFLYMASYHTWTCLRHLEKDHPQMIVFNMVYIVAKKKNTLNKSRHMIGYGVESQLWRSAWSNIRNMAENLTRLDHDVSSFYLTGSCHDSLTFLSHISLVGGFNMFKPSVQNQEKLKKKETYHNSIITKSILESPFFYRGQTLPTTFKRPRSTIFWIVGPSFFPFCCGLPSVKVRPANESTEPWLWNSPKNLETQPLEKRRMCYCMLLDAIA